MSGLFVTNPALPPELLSPVIGEELSADFLITPGSGYSISIDQASDVIDSHSALGMLLKVKFDPASTTTITSSAAGIKIDAPAFVADPNVFSGLGTAISPLQLTLDPASTAVVTTSPTGLKIDAPLSDATTFTYDAVGKTLNLAIDGNTVQTVNLAALDDEGAALVINGQNLELVAADGTVLSTTPITAIDAQQLTSAMAGNALVMTLSNGGEIKITCTEIGQMFAAAAGPVPLVTSFLADDCAKYTMADILAQAKTDNPPQTLAVTNASLLTGGQFELSNGGGTVTFAPIDCAAIKTLFPAGGVATAATSLFTGDCTSITAADVLALTTNTLAVVGGDLVSTVNGVPATVPAATVVDAAYSAAPVAPAAGDTLYGPGGKSVSLVQDRSSTGILMPTWSVR